MRYAVGTVAGVLAVLPAVATSYRNNLQYIYIYIYIIHIMIHIYIYTYIHNDIYIWVGTTKLSLYIHIYSVQSINMKGAEESSKLCKLESFRFN